ncbi:hypothetical protein [Chromobacterium violaceum]|uniref:hypothetical protein n=1 Tax=Chromobacterium violaceum TaxID=536 RepID=UPI0005BAEEFE|nr:hypothetical protein [Chromobacterium violaceum]
MTQQWIRAIKLLVQLDASGNALDLSAFRIRFFVKQAFTGMPGSAEIRIYNPSATTAKQLAALNPTYNPDGTLANGVAPLNVILQAGFEGNCDTIFKGQLRQARRGRENPTDTYVEILAQCADVAHSCAVMNTSLAAGWGPSDMHAAIGQSFSQYGINPGYAPSLPEYKMPRGRVMYGMTRDFMGNFADSHNLSWGYANDEFNCTPAQGTTNDQAVVINTKTGMIGMPELTPAGVNVRCLINPLIKRPGQPIKLDNASIQTPNLNVAYGADAQNFFIGQNALDADGLYKVVSIQHLGDTRGQMWYTDTINIGINSTQPVSGASINAVTPNYGP